MANNTMVDIQTIAAFLLLGRAISLTFIILVLIKQFKLFGTKIDFKLVPNINKYQRRNIYLIRKVLFTLSIIILLGNIVPVTIDVITLFGETDRPTSLAPISIAYAFSNSLTAMFSAIMIWTLYKLAGLGK